MQNGNRTHEQQDKLVSSSEVIKRLGISRDMFYKNIRLGIFPHVRAGTRIMVKESVLEKLIQEGF